MPAKKTITTTKTTKAKIEKPVEKTVTTPVRNSAIPKVTPVAKKEITRDMIAKRAYEIWASGKGGSELQNWQTAEAELCGTI